MDFMEAKRELLGINKLNLELKRLNIEIEKRKQFLYSPSNSIIVITENNNRKERTMLVAELEDLKDEFIKLYKTKELLWLELINKVDNLDNKDYSHYLRMRYIFCMKVGDIADQEHYCYQWVKEKIIEATRYYASVY